MSVITLTEFRWGKIEGVLKEGVRRASGDNRCEMETEIFVLENIGLCESACVCVRVVGVVEEGLCVCVCVVLSEFV